MRYVKVPTEIAIADIQAEGACFSPGRYVRFIPPKPTSSSTFAPLDKLVVWRGSRTKILKSEWYNYAEIGDINVHTGGIGFHKLQGFRLPTLKPAIAQKGDVLISTVRTYRKGIGQVTSEEPNLVTTNAVLNVCGVTDYITGLTLEYVYAFLRTDFFVEQVWSLLNRGVYPAWTKKLWIRSSYRLSMIWSLLDTSQCWSRQFWKRKRQSESAQVRLTKPFGPSWNQTRTPARSSFVIRASVSSRQRAAGMPRYTTTNTKQRFGWLRTTGMGS